MINEYHAFATKYYPNYFIIEFKFGTIRLKLKIKFINNNNLKYLIFLYHINNNKENLLCSLLS